MGILLFYFYKMTLFLIRGTTRKSYNINKQAEKSKLESFELED